MILPVYQQTTPSTTTTPAFYVGSLPIYGDVILSPMAGYSDVPYRAICRAYGSAMQYTEFVPVEALMGKRNRFWDRLDFKPGEYPKVFQIFGNDPQMILKAAVRVQALEPDIIDINMGCSTKRVSGRGAGVGMMRNPAVIAETFRLLSTHLNIPVTGKIRLGWDDQINFLEVGKILEENGAKLVALHGRTKEQKYTGRANWDAIARLKQTLSIPVIGNGDVVEPADIDEMKAYTGCDGVMVGRGAIGNPWLFGRKARTSLTLADLVACVELHLQEMVAYYGERFGLLQFRKHFKRYMAGLTELEPLVEQMVRVKEVGQFEEMLGQMTEILPAGFPLPAVNPTAEEACELDCEV